MERFRETVCFENPTKTLSFEIEAKAVFGASIDRAVNQGTSKSPADKKPIFAMTHDLLGNPRLREYYFTSVSDLLRNQILVLNIHFTSSKKLAIEDKKQTEVTFTDAMEPHVFRFETFVKSDDWLLTDIDSCLNGNPYFANK